MIFQNDSNLCSARGSVLQTLIHRLYFSQHVRGTQARERELNRQLQRASNLQYQQINHPAELNTLHPYFTLRNHTPGTAAYL